MTSDLGPGAHTRVRRLPEKARYDADSIFAAIDATTICHVAAVVDGLAMALPTLHVREGDVLFVHGSQSNALLKAVQRDGRAFVTTTAYDGVRVARSGFESSIAYRSTALVTTVTSVDDPVEKQRVLDCLIDVVLPGRSSEVRPMTERERNLTLVLALRIVEASAKVSAGMPDDVEADLETPIWAGVVPARLTYGEPIPATDGAMARGDIEVPPSVRRLLGSS